VDRKWLTFAVLAAGLVGVSLLIGLTRSGGSSGAPLQLQRDISRDGRPELLVTVGNDVNVASNAEGPTVELLCSDIDGATVIQKRHGWPLVVDSNPPAPHIHQPASQIELGKVDTCRITGTKLELTGRLGLR